jgi:hypothetical protein
VAIGRGAPASLPALKIIDKPWPRRLPRPGFAKARQPGLILGNCCRRAQVEDVARHQADGQSLQLCIRREPFQLCQNARQQRQGSLVFPLLDAQEWGGESVPCQKITPQGRQAQHIGGSETLRVGVKRPHGCHVVLAEGGDLPTVGPGVLMGDQIGQQVEMGRE